MSSGSAPRFCLLAGIIAGALLASSCADTRGGAIPYDRPLAAPDKMTVVALAPDYKIHPLDKLGIKVFKSNDISGDYDVDLAGNISLPLIGQMEAINLTTAELDQKLTDKLGEKYLENPDVAVAIKESHSLLITVDGSVKEGGAFPASGPITLVQAIALAKGTSDDANPRRVAVFRVTGGRRQAAAFDLTAIRRGRASDPQIYPGDIIVVDGSSLKAAQKQILATVPLIGMFRYW